MGRLATLRRCQSRLGIWAGLRWYAILALNSRSMLSGHVRIRCRELVYPFLVRGGSSDMEVFWQLMIEAIEYEFLERLSNVQTIIDLGANIGLSSAIMLSRFPTATVIAVEPDPGNCAILRLNLAPYGDRAQIIEGAIWSNSGEVSLESTTGAEWGVTVKEGHGVRAYSMEEILSRVGDKQIDLLKIDIEGSEVELLRGNPSWLRRVRNLCIETHGDRCKEIFESALSAYECRRSKCGEYHVCEGLAVA